MRYLCIVGAGLIIYAQSLGKLTLDSVLVLTRQVYERTEMVPRGVLEAIAEVETRYRHITRENTQPSCTGMPLPLTIMGLVEDGKGFFRSNLKRVSVLSGIAESEILESPYKAMLAYGLAIDSLMKITRGSRVKRLVSALRELTYLPDSPDNFYLEYAMRAYLYEVFLRLTDPEWMHRLGYKPMRVDLRKLVGKEFYRRMTTEFVNLTGCPPVPDYWRAVWVPADPSNYSSRTTQPTHIVQHTIQGTFYGAIAWFQNPSANVSAHYVIRARDGQVVQMVCEKDKAWHVGTENNYTIGIENEGFVEDPHWYTSALYRENALLVKDICQRRGIPLIRTVWWEWASTADYDVDLRPGPCVHIKGHQHYPNQSHFDPWQYWDWEHYFRLVAGYPPVETLTALSGTFTDPGGVTGNYSSDEYRAWLIKGPPGSTVKLVFDVFDLESEYDYLFIYDGDSFDDPLIGKFTGKNIPDTVTGRRGALLIEFRSDCGVTDTGWVAHWWIDTGGCGSPLYDTVLYVGASHALLSWSDAGASLYLVEWRRNTSDKWYRVSVSDTFIYLTGLASNAVYHWRVSSWCDGRLAGYAGGQFETLTDLSDSVSLCSGVFVDPGGIEAPYFNNTHYIYRILVPAGYRVEVSFDEFDLESGFDYLYVFDGADTTAPLLGMFTGKVISSPIVSSSNALTFRFVSDALVVDTGWVAHWRCIPASRPLIGVSKPDWFTGSDTLVFYDIGHEPIRYRFMLVAFYDSTRWVANVDSGFFRDDFDNDTLDSWHVYQGIWMESGGLLVQTDETNPNTNVWAYCNQMVSPVIMYHWKGAIAGSGTNKRAGLHFFCDTGALPNRGNSYFVYFREDHDKVQIYKVINDSWTLVRDVSFRIDSGVFYDFKVIFDRLTGDILVYVDDSLVAYWRDTAVHSVGRFVSFRSGNCIYLVDSFRVYGLRSVREVISVGPSTLLPFQNISPFLPAGMIHAAVVDKMLSISDTSFAVNIDWSPPDPPLFVTDSYPDRDTLYLSASYLVSWAPAMDPHSGVSYYEYSLGLNPGDSTLTGWMSTTDTFAIVDPWQLLPNATYYASVRAVNNAGLKSAVVSSDGAYVLPVSTYAGSLESAGFCRVFRQGSYIIVSCGDMCRCAVYTMDGRSVWRSVSEARVHKIPLSILSAGVYLVRVYDEGGDESRMLIMKAGDY